MNQANFNSKKQKGEIEEVKKDDNTAEVISLLSQKVGENKNQPDISTYLGILEALRTIKKPRSTAPTNIPRTYLDAIQFYVSGSTYRVYFYINKNWKYITLT